MTLGLALGQSQVNVQPAPAVAGDFASTNPRGSVLAGPGGLVAGVAGAIIARFAWVTNAQVDGDNAPAAVYNSGAGAPQGFIHREQQGLIPNYLQVYSMMVPAGFPITVMAFGDFWVVNDGATTAYPGQKAYANFADGKATFAATASAATAVATGTIAAGAGASATGVIQDSIFTATGSLSGTFVIGGVLSGTNVATGTQIVSQLLPLQSGETVGGLGRYTVSIAGQTVASTTISETWGVFTAVSGLTGLFAVGSVLTGTSVPAGSTITALGTGTGGLGTYITNLTGTASSTAITGTVNVETKWFARSQAAPGELVKMSSIS